MKSPCQYGLFFYTMHLLIDANNLAGALRLLEFKNFDERLIDVIKQYNSDRGNKITLVFDSADIMGDKFSENNINVVYTPRDDFYESADDKIIELAGVHFGESNDELKVITDDIELKNILRENNFNKGVKFKLMQASDFAKQLQSSVQDYVEDDRDLSDEEMNRINNELLELWK